MTLEALFSGRLIDIDAMLARLRQTAAQLDLPFGDRKHTYNSRRAQELGKWAETLGKGDQFHMAAFRAYFAQGENIARIPVLEEIADEYDGKLKICKLNIDENEQTPPKFNIRGIPTLMLFKNGNVDATKVGALSKSQLAAFLDSNL